MDSTHDHGHHDAHGHGGLAKYIYVFIALCALTTCSFMTYSDFWHERWGDTPAVGWVFMMLVSCTKALLVMLFFMHLKSEADWKYVLTIPASIMSLFLVLALVPDVGLRMRRYSPERRAQIGTLKDATAIENAAPTHHDEAGKEHAAAGGHPGH